MIDFTYPDINDALTVELIRSEYNGAYWGASERRLLTVAKEYISMAFGKDLKSLKHLDLGCGGGRLIPEFAALEGSVTALEPDLTRLEKARELVTGIGLDNVALFNEYSSTFLNKFPESIFDTVLCSHIFQHISHDTAAGILRDLHRMTTEDSVILITTTFADGEENRYTKEYFTDGARTSEPTDRQGFEAAMGCIGTLPVCSFARPYMEQLLENNGFETVHFGAYHFDDETDALNDAANTLDPARLPHARDAYYIVRKKLPKVSGKVTFSHFFYDKDGLIDETLLKADYEDRMTEEQLAVKRDFDICEGFLYGGGLHFEANRYYCGDRKVRVHAHGETFEAAHAHAVITVYPKEALIQVTFCINLEDTDARNMIFLHHIQNSPADFFEIDGKRISLPQWCLDTLHAHQISDPLPSSTGFLAEICKMGDHQKPDHFSDMEKKLLYGILTGDEGFKHVPLALAERRLSQSWSSRDFVKVIAFSNNILSINLNRSRTLDSYIQWQKDFAFHYYGGLNDYFSMNSSTGGINHGIFHSMETGLMIKSVTDMLMNRRPDIADRKGRLTHSIINANKLYRADMVRTLNKLEMIGISELGELDSLVAANLNVSQRVQNLQEILELLESELDLMYSTNTNTMVTWLTVVGLFFSLMQVILAIVE